MYSDNQKTVKYENNITALIVHEYILSHNMNLKVFFFPEYSGLKTCWRKSIIFP